MTEHKGSDNPSRRNFLKGARDTAIGAGGIAVGLATSELRPRKSEGMPVPYGNAWQEREVSISKMPLVTSSDQLTDPLLDDIPNRAGFIKVPERHSSIATSDENHPGWNFYIDKDGVKRVDRAAFEGDRIRLGEIYDPESVVTTPNGRVMVVEGVQRSAETIALDRQTSVPSPFPEFAGAENGLPFRHVVVRKGPGNEQRDNIYTLQPDEKVAFFRNEVVSLTMEDDGNLRFRVIGEKNPKEGYEEQIHEFSLAEAVSRMDFPEGETIQNRRAELEKIRENLKEEDRFRFRVDDREILSTGIQIGEVGETVVSTEYGAVAAHIQDAEISYQQRLTNTQPGEDTPTPITVVEGGKYNGPIIVLVTPSGYTNSLMHQENVTENTAIFKPETQYAQVFGWVRRQKDENSDSEVMALVAEGESGDQITGISFVDRRGKVSRRISLGETSVRAIRFYRRSEGEIQIEASLTEGDSTRMTLTPDKLDQDTISPDDWQPVP